MIDDFDLDEFEKTNDDENEIKPRPKFDKNLYSKSDFTQDELELIQGVSDWYLVPNDNTKSFCFPGRVFVETNRVLQYYADFLLEKVTKEIERRAKHHDMKKEDVDDLYLKLTFPIIQERRIFRVKVIRSVDGIFYDLRNIRDVVPTLSEIGMSRNLIELFNHSSLRSGLVLICGMTGNGKTTTCSAIIREHCTNRGTFALTIEDPPETPLHGIWGRGYCIQTEASKKGFAESVKEAMRSYPTSTPSILYVGEVRDAATAKEVIRASANGHLVFATMHGDDIISSIKRLVDIATGDSTDGRGYDIRTILASTLRLVVYQELKPASLSDPTKKRLDVSFVLSNGAAGRVGNALISNKLDALRGIISDQQLKLEKRGLSDLIEEDFIIKKF